MITESQSAIVGRILIKLGEAITAGQISPENFDAEIGPTSFSAIESHDVTITLQILQCRRSKHIIERAIYEAQGVVFKEDGT